LANADCIRKSINVMHFMELLCTCIGFTTFRLSEFCLFVYMYVSDLPLSLYNFIFSDTVPIS
jgi:hypothetical protein